MEGHILYDVHKKREEGGHEILNNFAYSCRWFEGKGKTL